MALPGPLGNLDSPELIFQPELIRKMLLGMVDLLPGQEKGEEEQEEKRRIAQSYLPNFSCSFDLIPRKNELNSQ